MRMPVRLLMIALMASTLALAGCSYTPARVKPEPVIEIDGHGGHRYYRGDDRHYRDRYPDHRRGGFCPPGLRMQGRC